jgi:membrane protein required for colicin V production
VNVLDLIFIIVVILFAVRCYFRGFVKEFLSMAALILGVFLAIVLYRPAGEFLSKNLGVKSFSEILGFIAVFLIVFILIKILQGVLSSVIDNVNLENVDRSLGFILGAAEGLLLVSVVLILLKVQPAFDVSKLLAGSAVARTLLPILVSATKLGGL